MICDVCGKEHEHYGGIHDANMIDFRWIGYAGESVTVERFALCPVCLDNILQHVKERREIVRALDVSREAIAKIADAVRDVRLEDVKFRYDPGERTREFMRKKLNAKGGKR